MRDTSLRSNVVAIISFRHEAMLFQTAADADMAVAGTTEAEDMADEGDGAADGDNHLSHKSLIMNFFSPIIDKYIHFFHKHRKTTVSLGELSNVLENI